MKQVKSGSTEHREAINADSDTEVIATTGAVTVALSNRKGVTILAPTGNTTGLTLAAPEPQDVGLVKTIANTTAFSAQVTVTGMVRATQNVLSFVAAADGVIGPSIQLKAVNVSVTATPNVVWVPVAGAGFVAGTSAVA